MMIQKSFRAASAFLQVALLPLLLNRALLAWPNWPFLALLGLVAALAGMANFKRPSWWAAAALLLAVIGSSSQWAMLPLALAQIGLGLLLATQKMDWHWQASGWLVEVTFLQLLLSASLTQGLTLSAPLIFCLINGLLLIAVWADRLPLVLALGLLLIGCGLGYWLKQFSLSFALLALLLLSLLNVKPVAKHVLPYQWAGIALAGLFYYVRMHG